MGKAKRKPRPSLPNWVYLDRDGCWFCKNDNNCNQCKQNKILLKSSQVKSRNGEKRKMNWERGVSNE